MAEMSHASSSYYYYYYYYHYYYYHYYWYYLYVVELVDEIRPVGLATTSHPLQQLNRLSTHANI